MNKFIVREGKSHNYTPIVLCYKDFIPQDSEREVFHPILTTSPYQKREVSLKYDNKINHDGNKEIFSILQRRFPKNKLAAKSLILLHTACNSLLLGLSRWLKTINREDIHVRLVFRWPITMNVYNKKNAEIFFQKTATILSQIGGDIRFYADNKELLMYYQQLTDISFSLTPIGIHFYNAPTVPQPREEEGLRFVFVGSPRMEKGVELICSAIEYHQKMFPKDIFHIHCVGGQEIQKRLNETYPENVKTYGDFLHGRPYFEYILRGDVVLLPYHAHSYHLRTSHIFMEALGLGRAVIVSKDTWMDFQCSDMKEKVGIVMQEWSIEALLQAMKELHEQRTEILKNAYNISYTIQQKHNPENWMQLMLEGL